MCVAAFPRACDLLCSALHSFSATWPKDMEMLNIFRKFEVCLCFHLELWAVLFLISQVAGIKGMFLANKKTDNQVKTHITYNRGRDWRLLQAPSKDLRGNSIHCVLVSVCISASVPRSYMFLYVCASIKERPWQELTHPSSNERQSSERAAPIKVLWGWWAERSAILIQSNKLTSHLRNAERKRCLTEKQTLLFHLSF